MLFEKNMGPRLSIDETALTNGELYTVITNKEAHGKKGSIVGMIEGTRSSDICAIVNKIPIEERRKVQEITLDMAESMKCIVQSSFPNAIPVTDRFHVQQMVSEAVQEIRIAFRKEVITEENEAIKEARANNKRHVLKLYANGDTKRQLLARSRYVLFKPESKWNERQSERAGILFSEYPKIRDAYILSMMFRSYYAQSETREEAKTKLENWYKKVEEKNIDSFAVVSESVQLHEQEILNYFINRSTNAGAESFNAKLKGFRSVVRGVRDKAFHLFRVAKIYG
jgi:transposase